MRGDKFIQEGIEIGRGLKIYETFEDFFKVLNGFDNINLVDFEKGYQGNSEERRNFVAQLLKKTGLNKPKGMYEAVPLFDIGRIQVGVYQKGDKLLIKVMRGDSLTTHEIDEDFKVSSKSVVYTKDKMEVS